MSREAANILRLGDRASYAELQSRDNPDGLAVVYVPSLTVQLEDARWVKGVDRWVKGVEMMDENVELSDEEKARLAAESAAIAVPQELRHYYEKIFEHGGLDPIALTVRKVVWGDRGTRPI
jgi:hypothetical protein